MCSSFPGLCTLKSLATSSLKNVSGCFMSPGGKKSPPLSHWTRGIKNILPAAESSQAWELDLWNSFTLMLVCNSGLTSYPECYLTQTWEFFFSGILSSYSKKFDQISTYNIYKLSLCPAQLALGNCWTGCSQHIAWPVRAKSHTWNKQRTWKAELLGADSVGSRASRKVRNDMSHSKRRVSEENLTQEDPCDQKHFGKEIGTQTLNK